MWLHLQFLYHQHWNKFFIETYDVLWKCLEFYFQITCTFHFATLLVSLLCFAGFLGESLLTLHAAKQILFFVITHILVMKHAGFALEPCSDWLLKLVLMKCQKWVAFKNQVVWQVEFSFFCTCLSGQCCNSHDKKKQFRQLNGLCGYKNTDDVTRVKVYWKVWKCRM